MKAEFDRIQSHYDAEAGGELYSDTDKVDEILKLNKVVCKALEKQIPKKPICVEDKMWCCPKCYNNLLNKWVKYPTKLVPKSAGLPYCMSCGQAIDWSEEHSPE